MNEDNPKQFVEDPASLSVMHEAVGSAYNAWQLVDSCMYVMTHALMKTSYEISSTCFFHVKSAESRASLIDKLIHQTIDQNTYQKEWPRFRKGINLAIIRRNALAHFDMGFITTKQMEKLNTEYSAVLAIQQLDYYGIKRRAHAMYTIEQLENLTKGFGGLGYSLLVFAVTRFPDWQPQQASLPLYLQQNLQTIRKKVSEAKPLPPAESSGE